MKPIALVIVGIAIGYLIFGWPRTSGRLIIPGES
jgi:hypothetical protein